LKIPFLKKGTGVNVKYRYEIIPLMLAVRKDNIATVKNLLAAVVNINDVGFCKLLQFDSSNFKSSWSYVIFNKFIEN